MTKSIIPEKTCTKCKVLQPITCFSKARLGALGVKAICKTRVKGEYQKNRERIRAQRRAYYRANAQEQIARQKRRREDNLEEARRIARERYRQRPEIMRLRNKINYRKNRAKRIRDAKEYHRIRRQQTRETTRRWRLNHREQMRMIMSNNRAMRHNAQGRFTLEQVLAKYEFHGWRCYLCGTPITLKTSHSDHRKPISKGGSNWIANIAPACAICNQTKSVKTEAEYRALMAA